MLLSTVAVTSFAAYYEWYGSSEMSDLWSDVTNWKDKNGNTPSSPPGPDDDVVVTFEHDGQQTHISVSQPNPVIIKSLRVTGPTGDDDMGGLLINPCNFTVTGSVIIDGAPTLTIDIGQTWFTSPNITVTSQPGLKFHSGFLNAPVFVMAPGRMEFALKADKNINQDITAIGSGAVLDFVNADGLVLVNMGRIQSLGRSASISATNGAVVNVGAGIKLQYQMGNTNTNPVARGDGTSWWYVNAPARMQLLVATSIAQLGVNGGGEIVVQIPPSYSQQFGVVRADGTFTSGSPSLVVDSVSGGGVVRVTSTNRQGYASSMEVQSSLTGVTLTSTSTAPTDGIMIDSRVQGATVAAINVMDPMRIETDAPLVVSGGIYIKNTVTLIGEIKASSLTVDSTAQWAIGQMTPALPGYLTVTGPFTVSNTAATVTMSSGSVLTLPPSSTLIADNALQFVGASRESTKVLFDSKAQLTFAHAPSTGYMVLNSVNMTGVGSIAVSRGNVLLNRAVFHINHVELGTGSAFSGVVADLDVKDVRALDDTTKVTMNVSNVFVVCPASCGAVTGRTTAQFNFTTKAAVPPPPNTPPADLPVPVPVYTAPCDPSSCSCKHGLWFFIGFLIAAIVAAIAAAAAWFLLLKPRLHDPLRSPLNAPRGV